jgi:hypothetical protein
VIQQPSFWDYGPRWLSEQIIEQQPPKPRGDYRVLVPKCDADGNDLDCLLPPEVKVPVATYTGWNLRNKQASAEGELVSLRGSYIPFAATKVQRKEKKDPRLSVEERYSSLEDYLQKLKEECQRLHRAGYFLEEDIPQTLAEQRKRVAPLFAANGRTAESDLSTTVGRALLPVAARTARSGHPTDIFSTAVRLKESQ